jgi:thermostable 8-oxoguanine DNA glycosylase
MITTQLPLPMRCSSDSLVQPELELKPTRNPAYAHVEEFFDGIRCEDVARYTDYWSSVAPSTEEDHFLRWVFAFMSVHTSWKSNVNGYNALKNWREWQNDQVALLNKLKHSGVGLHNNRAKFVSKFSEKFWANTSHYTTAPTAWRSHRDSLVKNTLGLGRAKVSFSLEMAHPLSAEVVCMDTHMFQAYSLDQVSDEKHYEHIEAHWINMCNAYDVPCYIARCLYWDRKQNKEDSRYWSYVLEA